MASKEKSKFKTPEKVKKRVSEPFNIQHTAHGGVHDKGWGTPQTGPPSTINLTTPTNADQKQDIVVEIKKLLATDKDETRETIRETIAEAMKSYKSHTHMVESSDTGVTESGDVSLDRELEKAASEDQEHGYQNVNWETTKLRRSLSDCDSSTRRKKPQNKTTETLEMRASSIPNIIQTPADDRECLANALQSHAVMMINDVLFTETQLPDLLSEQGFLTDEECSTMRGLANRKDRIRTLLSVMKGRDMDTIKGFLKILKRYHPEIVDKVYKTYNFNKANGMRCKLCAFCLMKTKVDIKYVVDSIWEVFAIPDGLYNEIVYSQKPAGAQEVIKFWELLAEFCNLHKTNQRAKAFEALIKGLIEKKYSHIANTFASQLHTGTTLLKCYCKVVHLRQRSLSIGSTATSISPGSSRYSSLTDVKGQENVSASLQSIYETVPVSSLTNYMRNTPLQSMDGDGEKADQEPACQSREPFPTNKPRKTSPTPLQKKPPKPSTKQEVIATTNVEGEVKQMKCGTEVTPTSMLSEGAMSESSTCGYAHATYQFQSRDGDGERADQEPACPSPVPLCTKKARKISPPPLTKEPPKPSIKQEVIATTNVEGEEKQMKGGTKERPTSMLGEGPRSESSTCGYAHATYQLQSRDGDGERADQEPACPPPVSICTKKARKTFPPLLPKKPPKHSIKQEVIATTNVEGEVKQMKGGTEETPTSMSGEGFVVKIEDQPAGNREISMPEGKNFLINDNR